MTLDEAALKASSPYAEGGSSPNGHTERGRGAVLMTEEQLLSMTSTAGGEEEEDFDGDIETTAAPSGRMEGDPDEVHISQKHRGLSKKQQQPQDDADTTTYTVLMSTKKDKTNQRIRNSSSTTISSNSHKTKNETMDDPSTTTSGTTGSSMVPAPPSEFVPASRGYAAPGAHRVVVNHSTTINSPQDNEEDEEEPPIAVTATLVTATPETPEEDLAARVRQQVLSEAVVAQVVVQEGDGNNDASSTNHKKDTTSAATDPTTKSSSSHRRKLQWSILLFLALIVIGVAIGVGLALSSSDKSSSNVAGTTSQQTNNALQSNDEEEASGEDENDKDNSSTDPPDWWIEISPDVVLPNSPQRRAFEWMTVNNQYSEQGQLANPKTAHMYALVTFYYATGGGEGNWLQSDGWLDPSTDLCDWYPGTMCIDMPPGGPGSLLRRGLRQLQRDGAPKLFAQIVLPDNGLVGTLPPELSLIGSLQTLDLSGNQLTGSSEDSPLPDLFQASLREVRLEGNLYTGTMPPTVCTPFTDVALPKGGVFAMDCLDTTTIKCPCCTICCLNGADCQAQ